MESKKLEIKSIKTDFEVSVLNLLNAEGRDFLTVTKIKNKLPLNILKSLSLKRTSNNSAFIKKTKTFLNGKLSYYRSRYSYIGLNINDEDLICNFLVEKELSVKKTVSLLPLTKRNFVKALNKLINDNSIYIYLNKDFQTFIGLVKCDIIKDEDIFENICKGEDRSYIRIHSLREKCSWDKERFDNVVNKFSNDGKVQLLGGDPSELSETEIQNSYVDSKGRLRIMLTWRNQ
ncbi:MAG: hypothetical protein GY714_29050 [Desulfobacterales bacterium]|nr:hypothetical protein [Desulfobacterales bacterium]MCP4163206.1 hypothetical protein [Deltaproteobacteria bacterium]